MIRLVTSLVVREVLPEFGIPGGNQLSANGLGEGGSYGRTAAPYGPPKVNMPSVDRRDFRCCDLEYIPLIVHQ